MDTNVINRSSHIPISFLNVQTKDLKSPLVIINRHSNKHAIIQFHQNQ